MSRTRQIINDDILSEIHQTCLPFPKDQTLDMETVMDTLWMKDETQKARVQHLLYPIWKKLSTIPNLSELDFDIPDRPELCTALIYLLDQSRVFLRGKYAVWVRQVFDPIAERIAIKLFNANPSPFLREAWADWSFESYVINVIMLWAPLIHSAEYMATNWKKNKEFLLYIRRQTEDYTGLKDPYAATQDIDERDPNLFASMLSDGPPSVKNIADYTFWYLRIITAHVPVTHNPGPRVDSTQLPEL